MATSDKTTGVQETVINLEDGVEFDHWEIVLLAYLLTLWSIMEMLLKLLSVNKIMVSFIQYHLQYRVYV
jgi:hypothetical protein